MEDEAITAMAEKMALEKYGYKVMIAHSGEEAVETVKKTPAIDLILMDIDLGAGIDGTEAAAIILNECDIPVVFLSSHMEPEVVAKTEKITSYGYIVKSSSNTVLDASIKMAFKLFEAKIKEKEKEKVLQDIIDKNPLSIQIVDKEGFTLKTNPAHTMLFGAVPPADFSIFNDLQLKQKGFGGLIERIKNGEVVHFPVTRYNAHDSVSEAPDAPVWIRTVVFSINDSSGKPENFVFMHENITENKEAESQREAALEALQTSKNDLLEAQKLAQIGNWTYDPVTQRPEWSEGMFRIWGMDPTFGAPAYSEHRKLIHPDDYRRFDDAVREAVEHGTPYRLDLRICRPDGIVKSIVTICEPQLDKAGRVVCLKGTNQDISERKQAEEALHVSEERFRAIIAHTPDHIIIQDRYLRYTFVVNPQLGLSEADMLGKTDLDFLDKGEAEDLIAIKQKVLDTGVPFYLQTSLQNLKGGMEHFEGSLIPKFDSAGKPDGLIGYFRNVTQRKLAEAQRETVLETLRESEKELQYLFKSMINAFVLFESIFDEKGDFVSYRFIYINDAYERITGVKNEEVKGKSVHDVWPETEAEWIKRYGEVAVTGVASEFELYHEPTKKFYHCNVYRPWDKRDRFCVVFEDITERKQAEEALQESEERYKALFDRSLDLIYLNDFEGRFIDANDAALNLLGYNREEMRGLNFASLLSEDQLPLALKSTQEIRETGFQKNLTEFRLRHKNGSEVYVETKGSAILSQGAFSAIQSIARDISERKRAEESLAQQNAAMSKLNHFSIELSMLPAEVDLEALITRRIKEIAGAVAAVFSEYNPESRTVTTRNIELEPGLLEKVVSLLGKQVTKIHSVVSDDVYREMTTKIIGMRKTLHEASFGAIPRPVGAAIQALLKADRFIGVAYLIEGKLYGTSLLAMGKDQPQPSKQILENFSFLAAVSLRRKRAEKALRESEERLQLILATLPVAIFTSPLDPGIDVSWMSGDVEKVTGFTVAEYMAENDFWRNRLHADDRERVLAAYGNPAAGDEIILEYRWLCKDGNYKWFYDRVIKKQTPQGIQYFGIIYDINERKRAEAQREATLEALRESEDRYRDLVENSQDLICTHDLEGKVLSINEAAVRLTGYPLDDLLTMNMVDLLMPEVRHLFKAYLAEIQAKGWAHGTMRVQTASGEPRYWEFHNTLRTKDVAIPVVRGVGRDITERERAEKEIKRQLAEKEVLLKEVHHRIKNNIASIGGLISLHMQSVTNPEAIAVLQDAIGRVNSMRILYDKLLITEDYRDISVKNYVESLADAVLALFPDRAKIKLEKQIADFQLDPKQLFPLGLIINELITNKMKYAFIDREAGLITISLKNIASHVTLDIRDNGNKLPAGFDIDKTKGFGLMLVKMLSQQLGGSFSMEKQAGTRCTVEFDI